MGEEHRTDEEAEREETIQDLEVADDDAEDVKGGARKRAELDQKFAK